MPRACANQRLHKNVIAYANTSEQNLVAATSTKFEDKGMHNTSRTYSNPSAWTKLTEHHEESNPQLHEMKQQRRHYRKKQKHEIPCI